MKTLLLISLLSIASYGSFSRDSGSGGQPAPGRYACETDLIEVMFVEDAHIRLRNSSLTAPSGRALEGLQQILDRFDWYTWYRFCEVPEETIDSWQVNGERNTGRPVYNLNNIYRLRIPGNHDIWEVCRMFGELPGVLSAIPVPKPVPVPVPPNYQPNQGYLNSAGSLITGIDAVYAWTQTGGTGTGITVCDLEYSWNYNHADISKAAGSQINTNVSDPFSNNNHGTAVIGELVADNNLWGTTGICYGSGLLTCGTYYGLPPSWNPGGAIGVAIANLNAGDIILLEQQWDYTGSGGYVPVEWYGTTTPAGQSYNGVYAAIQNAVSNGIHVVEAGGNGSVNMDLLSWYGDSGAIIVGAGGATTTNDLQKLSFSSYGNRFDLQGWGENVFTTGYGTYYSAEGVNYYYTSTFNGTSSASPIVAGAVACASGYYLANISSTPPTPSFIRSHLKTYGTAQVTPPTGNIGPRPDLYQAITNFPVQQNWDWGDAPDLPYPTLSINSGARHFIPTPSTLILGSSIDPDPDGQPNPWATGDDLDGNNDDDGVIFTSPLRVGQTTTLTVFSGGQGFLNAWIDFNGNGNWADPGEWIFTGQLVIPGPNNLTFTVPVTSLIGQTYARFRLSSVQILPYAGPVNDGEVEDYQVFIHESEIDWGDAPDPMFPTLASSNGARHYMNLQLFLGNLIDPEFDGIPSPNAMGDDLTNADDEDGVVFPFPLIAGQASQVKITASMPGFLNAWMDMNGDMDWNDPGEQIFTDQALNAGANYLAVYVPPGTLPMPHIARFRFSSQTGIPYFGPAPDGEVEDYEIFTEPDYIYKFNQEPDLTIMGMDVRATLQPTPLILADDWLCTMTGPIKAIKVWGSWRNDQIPNNDPTSVNFTLSIHSDIPASISLTGYSMPGPTLWLKTFAAGTFSAMPWIKGVKEGWYDPSTGLYMPMADTVCWLYNFFLGADEFIQTGSEDLPVVYWLDVQAAPVGGGQSYQFGWKTSISHWNDKAVWTIGNEPYSGIWTDLYYPAGHPKQGQPIDLAFQISGQENPYIMLDLKGMLEGAFNGSTMNTTVNTGGVIPLAQPYGTHPSAPWYYTGAEQVSSVPSSVVDWVLVELRETPGGPATATRGTMIGMRAAWIHSDGTISAINGSGTNDIKFYHTVTANLYPVVWHRNHLGIMSAMPLTPSGLTYSYDFTTAVTQVYGGSNGHKLLGGGIYGMIGGDGKPDGQVNMGDKNDAWAAEVGTMGYKMSDYNMDLEVNNGDKIDIWKPNTGKGSQVP